MDMNQTKQSWGYYMGAGKHGSAEAWCIVSRLTSHDSRPAFTLQAQRDVASPSSRLHLTIHPVKRVIRRNILNELSNRILAGSIDNKRKVTVDTNGDELVFKN